MTCRYCGMKLLDSLAPTKRPGLNEPACVYCGGAFSLLTREEIEAMVADMAEPGPNAPPTGMMRWSAQRIAATLDFLTRRAEEMGAGKEEEGWTRGKHERALACLALAQGGDDWREFCVDFAHTYGQAALAEIEALMKAHVESEKHIAMKCDRIGELDEAARLAANFCDLLIKTPCVPAPEVLENLWNTLRAALNGPNTNGAEAPSTAGRTERVMVAEVPAEVQAAARKVESWMRKSQTSTFMGLADRRVYESLKRLLVSVRSEIDSLLDRLP
jgi:hypothetical protein